MKSLRIVFMGTPDFAVPALQALVQATYDVVAVYTQPDKERGRGKQITYSPVKAQARQLGIPVYQPTTLREIAVQEELSTLKPDLIVVIAYGKILPKAVLTIPTYGCMNVHASLLPSYRGAAPIQYAIKDGVTQSGVTIMQMDEGLDTGDILIQRRYTLDPKETTGSLFEKLSELGASALLEVLGKIETYQHQAIRQDEKEASYTAKIEKKQAMLDWREDAVQLERWIRTLDPHPGAYTLWQQKRLKIWSATVVEGQDVMPGTIIAVTKTAFVVQTGRGALQIDVVQPESRKRMTTAQFLQGNEMTIGDSLAVPTV